MKVLRQESETSRIVQKFSIWHGIFEMIICRQRKGILGWYITTWLYTHQYDTIDGYVGYFDHDEEDKHKKMGKKQF